MLKCQSLDCLHNDKKGKCFAKKIAISGRTAQTTSETICDSYAPDYDFQNAEFAAEFMNIDTGPSDTQNIKCAALNCKFNTEQLCTATSVQINSNDASCQTFQQ